MASGVLGLLIICSFLFLIVGGLLNTVVNFPNALRRRREAAAARIARERNERARREWEKTPEGKACLDRKRQEAADEERRRAAELLQRQAAEHRHRQKAEDAAARLEWNAYFESKTMEEVACMTGLEFERFLARLLPHLGYTDVVLTPVNDQGGDLLCTAKNGDKVVVQAKRWKASLGNGVVQEILGAMLHYGCGSGMIITSSTFTRGARALADKDPRISLFDEQWLALQIQKHLPAKVPEFDWQRYQTEVRPPRRRSTPLGTTTTKAEILRKLAAGEMPLTEARKLLGSISRGRHLEFGTGHSGA